MKSISAAIVVLAGAVIIAGGAISESRSSRELFTFIGCAVGAAGLITWVTAFNRTKY